MNRKLKAKVVCKSETEWVRRYWNLTQAFRVGRQGFDVCTSDVHRSNTWCSLISNDEATNLCKKDSLYKAN